MAGTESGDRSQYKTSCEAVRVLRWGLLPGAALRTHVLQTPVRIVRRRRLPADAADTTGAWAANRAAVTRKRNGSGMQRVDAASLRTALRQPRGEADCPPLVKKWCG